jgi:hypothetical protein
MKILLKSGYSWIILLYFWLHTENQMYGDFNFSFFGAHFWQNLQNNFTFKFVKIWILTFWQKNSSKK